MAAPFGGSFYLSARPGTEANYEYLRRGLQGWSWPTHALAYCTSAGIKSSGLCGPVIEKLVLRREALERRVDSILSISARDTVKNRARGTLKLEVWSLGREIQTELMTDPVPRS